MIKKAKALSVLITMALGLVSWAGATFFDHESRLSRQEERVQSLKEIAKETRDGVKTLIKIHLNERK